MISRLRMIFSKTYSRHIAVFLAVFTVLQLVILVAIYHLNQTLIQNEIINTASNTLTVYNNYVSNAVNRADEKVQQAYRSSRDGIVVLPCYLPWKNGLYKTDALFVVYPSQRGGWSAQCVTDHKTKRPKLPFPQSWAGQPQEVIEQKSGIPGISFCHASRFLITAKDKETALAACRQVLKNNGRI